jgi:integrase
MLLTGLRVGELGALYLTDIDDETIHVKAEGRI